MTALTKFNLVLLAVCALLAVVVHRQSLRPLEPLIRPAPQPPAVVTAAPVAASPAFRMPPRDRFSQLQQRPPFSASRQPYRPAPPAPPKPVAVAPKPLAPPKIILVGVVINAAKGVAVVEKPGQESPLRLGLGDAIDGWKLEHILPDRIVLTSSDKAVEVELRKDEAGDAGSR